MFKRAFAAILLLAVFACLAVPAWADEIWIPDDYFYMHHYGRTAYIDRMYYTNGDEGCVVAYTEPAGGEAVAVLPNGCEMYVSVAYKGKDGRTWVVIQFEYDEDGMPIPNYGPPTNAEYFTGWVPLESMLLIYDYKSFEKEFGDEFERFTGDAAEYIDIDKTIYCWSYPGAEKPYDPLKPSEFKGTQEPISRYTWRDEEGRLWGYMDFFYGYRNCWVCLSDPENDSLPPVQRGEPVNLTPTDTKKVERGVKGLRYQSNNNIYISLAVSLVMICAGGAAYILLKKKTEKRGD